MIIECPSCTSRYRIREDKLPEAGGNIKCPNCAHIFFVPRADGPLASISGSVPAIPSDPVPAATPPPVEAGEGGKRWKLKNPVGLIYDFPDTNQIRSWLVSRESFEGMQVSSDTGSTWMAVEEEPDLVDVKPTGSKIAPQPVALRNGGARPAAQSQVSSVVRMKAEAEARLRAARRTRVDQTTDPEYKLIKAPATKEEEQTSRLLLILSLLILPGLAAIAADMAGVIDLQDIKIFEAENPELPPGLSLPDRGYLPTEMEVVEQPEISSEQAIAELIDQAGSAQARGDAGAAIERLESAVSLAPEDAQLACLLAPLYEAEQRTADAAEAAERCAASQEEEAGGSGDVQAEPTPPTGQEAEGSGAPSTDTP